jgi:FMN phosphatase YigB (HAD superfamily)
MSALVLGKEVDAIVLDVDGTLYSQERVEAIFADVRRQISIRLLGLSGELNPNEELIDHMRTEYMARAEAGGSFSQAYIYFGGTGEEFRRLVESTDRSRHLTANLPLKDMVTNIKNLTRIGIFTSTTVEVTNNTCSKLFNPDWASFFDTVLCCDTPEVEYEKPQIEAFELVLSRLNTDPKRAVMVGDTPGADLVPAMMLGMTTIQVGRTDFPYADLYISDILDLERYITPIVPVR